MKNLKSLLYILVVVTSLNACKKSNNNTQTIPPGPAVDTLMSWTKSEQLFKSIGDIWFSSSGTGFLLGFLTLSTPSSIYTSTDLGLTWTMVPNTNSVNAFNLQFVDDQTGFAQGPSAIEVTSDGGKTWSTKKLPSPNAIYSQFLSALTGFYADMVGGIARTTDGGDTWIPSFGYQDQNQRSPFYFIDSLTGYTVADLNFRKTTDGGINWQIISSYPEIITVYSKMQMFDTLTGFLSVPEGVLKTVDGGHTWTNTLSVAANNLSFFQFIDRSNGYVIRDNSIYKTTDGGQTWNLNCRLGTDKLSGMHFTDMDHGWACTFGGYVLTLK